MAPGAQQPPSYGPYGQAQTPSYGPSPASYPGAYGGAPAPQRPVGPTPPYAGASYGTGPTPPYAGGQQPQHGAYAPAGAYGPGQMYGAPVPPGPGNKRKSKTPMVLGIVGGAVVLIIVVIVILANTLGAGPTPAPGPNPVVTGAPVDKAATPEDAITGYFDALAQGNSQQALSYTSTQPSDTTFLTDEVLQATAKDYPITGVAVSVEDSMDTFAYGTATYNLGDHMVSWHFNMEKFNGVWMLDQAAATVDLSEVAGDLPLKINGVAVDDPTSVTLFPGQYKLTTTNSLLTFGKKPMAVETPDDTYVGDLIDLQLALSSDGTKAIQKAAKAKLDGCLKQKSLKPSGCSYVLTNTTGHKVDTDTIKWKLHSGSDKIEKIKPKLKYDSSTIATANVDISIDFTANTTDGGRMTSILPIHIFTVTADISNPKKILISLGS